MTESNFHKWNEPIYYEIINLICSKEGIKYEELLSLLDKQKENFHLKYMPDEKYHKAIEDVILDLITHDVLLVLLSSLKTTEHIPIGTDLFEYLRDKGVI